ncbi:hypothetical protein QQ008_18520 [Fulvivirgaceae bacterium BMA10]|uniref:Uncharacterized protein n=1 Tax=Splendidivirga corallicola TaxID=3051826 RepID=A0ABT8KUT5_9BACT|nr:hypothetical protein [Fulvivirgaceae bacterium BMA10]
MQNQDEFYIGYLPKAPKKISGSLKLIIFLLMLIMAFVAFMVVANEEKFDESTFEYGKLTELKGVIVKHPVPMLKVKMGIDPDKKEVYRSFILVNFGKMGVYELVDDLASKMDEPLDQYEVTVQGTLIYFDGKTLLELSNQSASIINFEKRDGTEPVSNFLTLQEEAILQGEIIDPKCYFGVMKPGFGKVHRSCAVRCISGGIPPVLMMKDKQGEMNYVLLTDYGWGPINQKILDKVGKAVRISGQLQSVDDWYVLKVNEAKAISLLEDPIHWGKDVYSNLVVDFQNSGKHTCPYHPEMSISLCQ